MISIKQIQRLYGQNVCRHCINKLTGARLERRDCVYDTYQRVCPSCELMQNIVMDLRFSGKLKLMGKKL